MRRESCYKSGAREGEARQHCDAVFKDPAQVVGICKCLSMTLMHTLLMYGICIAGLVSINMGFNMGLWFKCLSIALA